MSNIAYDGQFYDRKSDVADLGSIECIRVEGMLREYRGLSADASKLPKYDGLATGSSCLMQDTGEYYEYNAKSKTWYKM